MCMAASSTSITRSQHDELRVPRPTSMSSTQFASPSAPGKFIHAGLGIDLTGYADVEPITATWPGRRREEEFAVRITVVGPADLPELLPLVRAYCDFYQVAPSDQALLELSRALLADPAREGLQLLARDDAGRAVGFATLYWTWQTLVAARVGVMNDLFVAPRRAAPGWPRGSSAPAWSAAASTARPGWSGRRPVTTVARRPSMSGSGRPARSLARLRAAGRSCLTHGLAQGCIVEDEQLA
jgi:hypothetical protein